MVSYFSKYYGNLVYSKDGENQKGLRNAQIGAIHSISSYFSLNNQKAALVVMPTGSGKTAVLMMTPYVLTGKRVLVVTPSKMVRGQIAEDFSTLRTLCKANVFKNAMKKPKVFELERKFNELDTKDIMSHDVIVSTPNCALSLSESDMIKQKIDIVLIDEAHHVPARTWEQILINLSGAKHVLFTATPFRMDKKEIRGDIIYNYPLSLAYSDGIFGEIQYIPIQVDVNKDELIAKKAEQIFLIDREKGLNHYLMVRTDTRKHAEYLEELYSKITTLKLKRIESTMSNTIVKKCIDKLKSEKLDGIICVDMLGEGFDFPNLKIAAIHSPHKSLASTLQFIGRFARTNASNIGTAKFIAMNDTELEIENNHLYVNDAVWQDIIINMSENKTKQEEKQKEYFEEFKKDGDFEEIESISLHAIRPNCHAKVYRVSGFDLNGKFPDECNVANRVYVNKKDNTVIAIGEELTSPKWLIGDLKKNVEYTLFIVHYQKSTGLLFIYSQYKSEVMYEGIVSAFCEAYDKISQYKMNRVLGGLTEFEIFNSGMQNRYNESGESYRISAGSDVSSAIDPATGKIYSPGHVFCKANSATESLTIGYSSGSKMWSSSYLTIPDYVVWCDENGNKINNDKIVVKTNTNYDLLPMPKELEEYPDNIFMVDFNPETYSVPPVFTTDKEQGMRLTLLDSQMSILYISKKIVKLMINVDDLEEILECDVQGRYKSTSNNLILRDGRNKMSVSDYLNTYPLSFRTTDDTMINGNQRFEGNPDAIVYDGSGIEAIDWNSYGTDIGLEVDNPKKVGKKSIQSTLKEILLNDSKYKYVIFDHSKGEIADYITVQEEKGSFIVTLFHVKKMSAVQYNSSVSDIYEVAGQAVKSTIWLKTKSRLLAKMAERKKSGHCKFIKGKFDNFRKEFLGADKQFIGSIVMVQPSISKSVEMPDKIQEVLAASTYYIKNSGRVKELKIYGSK